MSGQPDAAGSQRLQRDKNRRTRVPQGSPGTERPREPAGFPGRPATVSRSRVTSPPVADEAPAYPSHPRPHRRGRTARGRAAGALHSTSMVRRMDGWMPQKASKVPAHGKADGDALLWLLGARVEIEPRIEDAHVVGARVVVENGERLPHAQADTSRREQLVGLADDRGVLGRRRRWRLTGPDPAFGRRLRRRLAGEGFEEGDEIRPLLLLSA